MRAYELMIIFEGASDDAAVRGVLDAGVPVIEAGGGRIVNRALIDAGGNIVPVKPEQTSGFSAGKRRFAYEINHKWEGIYVVLEIVTEGSNLHDLERQLRLADPVVRHKLIRLPDAEAARRGLLEASGTAS